MCRLAFFPAWGKDREGEEKVEGKIEGRGTRRGFRPGLHVGWRGTRLSRDGAALDANSLSFSRFIRASSDLVRWSRRRGAV